MEHDLAYTVIVIESEMLGEKVLFDAEMAPVYHTPGVQANTLLEWSRLADGMKQPREVQRANYAIFVDVHLPPPHLIIVGGAHVAMPLQTMAKTLGFRVTLVDPRPAFASPERFPLVDTILHQYPDDALPTLKLNPHTYMAVLAHDPKIDDLALLTALESDVSYIGVMSSKRAHQERTIRLRERGVSDEKLARLHTPIGLIIGSKTPEEIAVSIISEIIAVSNGVEFSN